MNLASIKNRLRLPTILVSKNARLFGLKMKPL